MKTFESIKDWLPVRREIKAHGTSLGFVPTMGALHAGHISLIDRAKKENELALASIFVNPTQFNNKEDLEKYPRTLETDLAALKSVGVDYVILPNAKEMYADDYRYKVTENEVSKVLCGAHRPGHFDGVLTVVMKLLGLAQAQKCYMGEKDYQQFLLVKEMAENLFVDTEIVPCPIIREKSGLAMSSRNERLSPAAREKATAIYKYLNSSTNTTELKSQLTELGFEVEYAEEKWGRRFVAAWLEGVRLIDNVEA